MRRIRRIPLAESRIPIAVPVSYAWHIPYTVLHTPVSQTQYCRYSPIHSCSPVDSNGSTVTDLRQSRLYDIRAFTTRLTQMTSYWAKVCLFKPFHALMVFRMWPDGSKHCFKMSIPYGVAGQKLKVPRNYYEASNFTSTSPATMRGTSSRRTAAAVMVLLIAAAILPILVASGHRPRTNETLRSRPC